MFSVLSSIGILGLVEAIMIAFAIVVVPRGRRRPSSVLAWILLIILLPLVGAFFFLLIGNPKLPHKRREMQRRMNERIEERARDVGEVGDDHAVPPWLPSIVRLNQKVGAMPLLEDNEAHLLPHFEEQLTGLVAAVDRARRYVHVEFFILTLDATTRPFFAALKRAVERGVKVRVLLDHMGSFGYPDYRETCRELDRIGADWRLILPVQPLRGRYQRPDLRNHRKLLVVDGEVAHIGSLNMIDPSYNKKANRRRNLAWRDLMVRVHGPVVHEIDAVFVTDWYSETGELLRSSAEQAEARQRTGSLLGQVVPSGPGFELENNLMLFNTLIYYAQRRLSITSPYFVPDESLLNAITTAARRGVAVELFASEISDQFLVFHSQHAYYQALLEAGVRIYLYPAPAIQHSKHLSVDELVTVVGSSNLDIRSLALHHELSLMTCDRAFADELRAVEDEYRGLSRELTLEEWSRRSWAHKYGDDLARLASAVV